MNLLLMTWHIVNKHLFKARKIETKLTIPFPTAMDNIQKIVQKIYITYIFKKKWFFHFIFVNPLIMKLTKKEGNFELLNNNGPKHLYIHNIYFKSKNKSQSIQTDVLYFLYKRSHSLSRSLQYIYQEEEKKNIY